MELERLSEQDGVALLGQRAGERRIRAEPRAAVQLVGLCAGLPIALQLAGARLANDSRLTVAEVVAELTAERRRLNGLAIGAELVLAAVFATVYRHLPESAAQVYRSLAILPGPDFAVEVAAVVAGVGVGWVRGDLTTLADHQLVHQDDAGRYYLPPLARRYAERAAAASAAAPGGDQALEDSLQRVLEYYLAQAARADRAVMGTQARFTPDPDAGIFREAATGTAFADGASAIAWLERERLNLMATLRAAGQHGRPDLVWQFAETLTALFLNHRHLPDWYDSGLRGAAAARACARPDVEARLWSLTSRAMIDLGRLDEAGIALDTALALAENLARTPAEGSTQNLAGNRPQNPAANPGDELLGSVWEFRGRWLELIDRDQAIAAYRRSIDLNVAAGQSRGAAAARFFLQRCLDAAGRSDEAIPALTEIRETFTELSDQRMAARVLIALGVAHNHLDRPWLATDLLKPAITLLADDGLLHYEAEALGELAEVRERLEDRAGARECLRRAIELDELVDSPRLPRWRARLAALEG